METLGIIVSRKDAKTQREKIDLKNEGTMVSRKGAKTQRMKG